MKGEKRSNVDVGRETHRKEKEDVILPPDGSDGSGGPTYTLTECPRPGGKQFC